MAVQTNGYMGIVNEWSVAVGIPAYYSLLLLPAPFWLWELVRGSCLKRKHWIFQIILKMGNSCRAYLFPSNRPIRSWTSNIWLSSADEDGRC